jgi:hypothetical protein
MLELDLPTYSWFPTQSATSFSFSLTSSPSFVVIYGGKIQIHSTDPADTGTGSYTITILATETHSGLTNSQSFVLQVNCLTALAPNPALDGVTYYVGDTTTSIPVTFSFTPDGCPNLLVYTVTKADDSALPTPITYASGVISVHTDDATKIGTYSIKVLVVDPNTSTTNTQTFSVEIKCTKSISVQANTIPASTTYVLDPNNLNTIHLTSPTYAPNKADCPFTPSLSIVDVDNGGCPAWITCNPGMNSDISIGTTDHTLAGTFNFRIDFTDSISGLTKNTVTFSIIIEIMDATSITLNDGTSPGDQVYAINDSMLELDLPTYSWFPTQSATSFSFSLTSPPSFVVISGGKIQIHSTDPADTGTGSYTITILATETHSGLTNSQSFVLQVNCLTALAPNPALGGVTYYVGDTTTSIPVIFSFTPDGCPNLLIYTVTMADDSALPTPITYASGVISVQTNDFADLGTYSIKVLVVDPNTSTTNTQTFSIDIKCTKNIVVQANTIPASTTYVLDPNNLNTIHLTSPIYASNKWGCSFTPSLSIVDVDNGGCPDWITCNPGMNSDISIATTDHTLAGTYNFRIDFTDSSSGLTKNTVTFSIVIRIMDATSITLNDGTVPSDQVYSINDSMLELDVPTYSWFPTQSPTVFTYSLTSGPSFVTISGSKIQIHSTDPTDTGLTGLFTITILTTDTNSGLTNSQSFGLQVNCVTAITPSPALGTEAYYVTDSTKTIPVTFSLTPNGCPNFLVYTVTLADDSALPTPITYSNGVISIQTDDVADTASHSIKVVVIDPHTSTSNTQTFSINIKCTKSIVLSTNPIPESTEYILNPDTLL